MQIFRAAKLHLVGFDLLHDEALGREELRGSVKRKRARDEFSIPAEVMGLTRRPGVSDVGGARLNGLEHSAPRSRSVFTRRITKMAGRRSQRKWSAKVTEHSDALDLEQNVFTKGSAEDVARSLKRSAETSDRRKSSPFRSAMSMLSFYINRGGRNLSPSRKRTLELAKGKLGKLFGRTS